MPHEQPFHTLVLTDDEWAILTDPNTPDAKIAYIVRANIPPASRTHAGANRENSTSSQSNISSKSNNSILDSYIGEGVVGGAQPANDGTKVPPTIEAVKALFKEKGVSEDEGEAFWNYWETRGWLLANKRGKMKNWRCAVATWIRNMPQYNAQPKPTRPMPQPRRPDNYLPPTEEERKRNASLF